MNPYILNTATEPLKEPSHKGRQSDSPRIIITLFYSKGCHKSYSKGSRRGYPKACEASRGSLEVWDLGFRV